MRELWKKMLRALEAGQPVELVTILDASGSTPRGAGAVMAVFSHGESAGTVGGGAVEYEAQQAAAALLERGEDDVRRFRFVQGDAASLGMVCGGDVTVQFQFLPGGEGPCTQAVRSLTAAFSGSRETWLLRRIECGRVVEMRTADRTDDRVQPGLLENGPVYRDGWFAMPVVRAGKVYIFGGGHVSRALVPVIAAAEFRPVVYDDRPEFVTPEAFPQAEGLLCGPFTELSRSVTVTPEDYVVIMTRGHQADYEVLSQVLRSGAKYLGCIGSRRKLALCKERLLAAGFTEAEYARLHAPIGLAIGAQTPPEIAVSVAAELIAVRAGVRP